MNTGVPVRLSSKSARIRFQGCGLDYIANVCHGKCCETTDPKTKTIATRIPVTEKDAKVLAKFDVQILGGQLVTAPGKKCPFKQETGLCGIHVSGEKPFGCWVSPFKLAGRTLIIRKRYIGMKCHTNFRDTGLPAYIAFYSSLQRLFGEQEAARIRTHFDTGGGDLVAHMLAESYALHRENEIGLRNNEQPLFTTELK